MGWHYEEKPGNDLLVDRVQQAIRELDILCMAYNFLLKGRRWIQLESLVTIALLDDCQKVEVEQRCCGFVQFVVLEGCQSYVRVD